MNDPDGSTQTVDDAAGSSVLPPLLSPGTPFAGRYELREVLGVGGFAVVYAAYDRQLSATVAIKVLRADRLTESAVARFRREVLIARRTDSPRLVQLYDIGETDGTFFITMEYIDGASLREELRGGALSVERVAAVAIEVAAALSVLHKVGIVHRDLKPENILVARSGEIKLADFGLARQTEESGGTQTHSLVGTFEYLSPEHALGKSLDSRSDLYSLGVLLFEMLTGTLPYSTRTSIGALLAHVQQRPRNIRGIRPDIPRWLARIVNRLLEKDPSRRYGAASEVECDLRRRRAAWSLRAPARAAVTVAVLLLLGAGSLAGWQTWQRYRESRFQSLVRDGTGVRAVDRLGRTLWRMDRLSGPNVAIAKVLPEGRPVAVAIPYAIPAAGQMHSATIHDLQTGEVLRRVHFPRRAHLFPSFSDTFFCTSILATDVDGDGWDEIIAAFAHNPYWPSYTILQDGRTGTLEDLFVASGRHEPIDAVDVDGDSRKEVIFVGPSNRMGWYTGVAAVRVTSTNQWVRHYASTPDTTHDLSSDDALAWYALLPTGAYHIGRSRIDRTRGEIRVAYPDGRSIALGLDGFRGSSSLPSRVREAARRAAYRALRDATRALASGMTDDAIAASEEALRQARTAGDETLEELASRLQIRSLIAAGRDSAAAETLARFRPAPSDAPNAAWDFARAYHLVGRTDDAVHWYRSGYSRGDQFGRLRWEFLNGLVLALAEKERWQDAEREIELFASAHPSEVESAWCRRFVRWRTTGKAELTPPLSVVTDTHRYWEIEFQLAAGVDPIEIETRLHEALRVTSEVGPLLASAQAELLARQGRHEEAHRTAAEAVRSAEALAADDPLLRAHLPVLRKRLATLPTY